MNELDWDKILNDLYDPNDLHKLNIAMVFYKLINTNLLKSNAKETK